MREFNTEGPVVAEDHYHIPPLDRANPAEIQRLLARKRYFVLHAPRQTGKTSALLALQGLLNARGDYLVWCVTSTEASGPAERAGRLPLRLRQRGRRDNGPRRRGSCRPHRPQRAGRSRSRHAGRRLPCRDLARRAGQERRTQRIAGGADSLGAEQRPTAGPAPRRDRRAGGRLALVGVATTPGRLPPAPRGLPPERGPVRRPGRARLPHPLRFGEHDGRRRQRLQHQGRVVALGRLLPGRSARPARTAYRRNRPAVHRWRVGRGPDADPGPALARQRTGLPCVLPRRAGEGQVARRDRSRCA